jgi:hypothetical protein
MFIPTTLTNGVLMCFFVSIGESVKACSGPLFFPGYSCLRIGLFNSYVLSNIDKVHGPEVTIEVSPI